MYWDGSDYDDMLRLVVDIYVDYGIKEFPIDEKELCRKMGILLIPYSEYPDKELLKKRSREGFFIPISKNHPPMILYNDDISEVKSYGRMRTTIFHEIKHIANGDVTENEKDEDLAEYFAKNMMCPIPLAVIRNITQPSVIISEFETSYDMACNIVRNVISRRRAMGTKILEFEKPLLEQLGIGGDAY